jgi:large subunit ribosomal protein L23
MKDIWRVLMRPIITEKGVDQKDNRRTLTFQVHPDANKSDIKQAVQRIFKVKVESVQTANFPGKERRRGRFTGHRPDWKKAYVKLKRGEKMVEFAEHR